MRSSPARIVSIRRMPRAIGGQPSPTGSRGQDQQVEDEADRQKQANKAIDQRAPGLRVAHADTAGRADTAVPARQEARTATTRPTRRAKRVTGRAERDQRAERHQRAERGTARGVARPTHSDSPKATTRTRDHRREPGVTAARAWSRGSVPAVDDACAIARRPRGVSSRALDGSAARALAIGLAERRTRRSRELSSGICELRRLATRQRHANATTRPVPRNRPVDLATGADRRARGLSATRRRPGAGSPSGASGSDSARGPESGALHPSSINPP